MHPNSNSSLTPSVVSNMFSARSTRVWSMSAAEAQAEIGRTLAPDPARLSAELQTADSGLVKLPRRLKTIASPNQPTKKSVPLANMRSRCGRTPKRPSFSVRGLGVNIVQTAIGTWSSLPERTSRCLTPSVASLNYCESVGKLTFRHWRYRKSGSARARTLLARSQHRSHAKVV